MFRLYRIAGLLFTQIDFSARFRYGAKPLAASISEFKSHRASDKCLYSDTGELVVSAWKPIRYTVVWTRPMKCTSNRNNCEKRGGLEQTGVHFRITKISGSRSVENIITFFAAKQSQGPLKKKNIWINNRSIFKLLNQLYFITVFSKLCDRSVLSKASSKSIITL